MSAITVTRPTEDAALAVVERSQPKALLPIAMLRARLTHTQATSDRAGARLIENLIVRTTGILEVA